MRRPIWWRRCWAARSTPIHGLQCRTRALDKGPKQAIYAREGVAHLWFVDPDVRSLAAFALRGGRYAPIGKRNGDDPVSLPPFDAIEFSLADLWPPAKKP